MRKTSTKPKPMPGSKEWEELNGPCQAMTDDELFSELDKDQASLSLDLEAKIKLAEEKLKLEQVKPSPQLERKGMTKQAPQQITQEVVQARTTSLPENRDTTNLKAIAVLCVTHLITVTILATLFMFLWSNK